MYIHVVFVFCKYIYDNYGPFASFTAPFVPSFFVLFTALSEPSFFTSLMAASTTVVVSFSSGINLRKAKKKPRDTRDKVSGTPVYFPY